MNIIDLDNAKIWKILNDINQGVNNLIIPESDLEHYNKQDYWTYPYDYKGDCEDYAIVKKIKLEKYGIKSYFATCWNRSQEYHAVLIIHSNYGDVVLDNLNLQILNFSDVPYKWHKIEGEDGKWFTISDS